MSINDVKITQDERFTFVKTKMLMMPKIVFAVIFAILALLPVELTVPNIIWKIVFAVVCIVFLISLLGIPRNGLYIYKTGKIKLVSGFGADTFDISEIKRIAVNFTEWETGEFSAQLKFVFNEGDIISKNYAKKFENTSNHLFLKAYTIPRQTVDEFCQKLSEMNICNISIIDANKDIVYQNIAKH